MLWNSLRRALSRIWRLLPAAVLVVAAGVPVVLAQDSRSVLRTEPPSWKSFRDPVRFNLRYSNLEGHVAVFPRAVAQELAGVQSLVRNQSGDGSAALPSLRALWSKVQAEHGRDVSVRGFVGKVLYSEPHAMQVERLGGTDAYSLLKTPEFDLTRDHRTGQVNWLNPTQVAYTTPEVVGPFPVHHVTDLLGYRWVQVGGDSRRPVFSASAEGRAHLSRLLLVVESDLADLPALFGLGFVDGSIMVSEYHYISPSPLSPKARIAEVTRVFTHEDRLTIEHFEVSDIADVTIGELRIALAPTDRLVDQRGQQARMYPMKKAWPPEIMRWLIWPGPLPRVPESREAPPVPR